MKMKMLVTSLDDEIQCQSGLYKIYNCLIVDCFHSHIYLDLFSYLPIKKSSCIHSFHTYITINESHLLKIKFHYYLLLLWH